MNRRTKNRRQLLGRRFCRASLAAACALYGASVGAQTGSTYSYDAQGRLIGVTASGVSTTYAYDAAGNRTNFSVAGGPPKTLNGDFEAPALARYAYSPAAPDLVFQGSAGISVNGDDWHFPVPWSGRQVVFLQSNNNSIGFVEIKAVNLVVGRRYQFAFAATQRPGYPANSLRVLIDGALVWNAPPSFSDRFAPYPTQSFIASQTTAVVRFESSPTAYDSASGIDAVSVQQLD